MVAAAAMADQATIRMAAARRIAMLLFGDLPLSDLPLIPEQIAEFTLERIERCAPRRCHQTLGNAYATGVSPVVIRLLWPKIKRISAHSWCPCAASHLNAARHN